MEINNNLAPQPRLTWGFSATLMIFSFILFQNALPIGNNFNYTRFYTIYLFLPAIGTLMVLIILQKWISLCFLKRFLGIMNIGICWGIGIIAWLFESIHGDALMYITGYIMIYHFGWYSATIAGSLGLFYITTLDEIANVREKQISLSLFYQNILRSTIVTGISLLLVLYLAENYGYGISNIVMGSLIGMMIFADKLIFSSPNKILTDEIKQCLNPMIQSNSRLKNSLMILSIYIINFIGAFLWQIDFIRYANWKNNVNVVMYYLNNQRLIIPETLVSISVFGLMLLIALHFWDRILKKLAQNVHIELIWGSGVIGLLIFLWGCLHLGQNSLPIRYSGLFIPWVTLVELYWIITFIFRRDHSSPGVLGLVYVIGSFSSWIGINLGSEPESDYSTGLFIILYVILVGLFIGIYWGIRSRSHLIENKSENNLKATEIPQKLGFKGLINKFPKLDRLFSIIKSRKTTLRIIALLLLIGIPSITVFSTARPSGAFQLLANVDNNCIFYLVDPVVRIDQNYKPYFGLTGYSRPENAITLSAAKNEYESIQIVMLPINQKTFSLYDVQFSGFNHSTGGTHLSKGLFHPYILEYVEAQANILPDILIDFHALSIADGLNHPLWFTFYVPSSADSGDYTGKLTFTVDNKTDPNDWYSGESVEFQLQLHVFNFTLPEIPTLKSNFGTYVDDPLRLQQFQEHRMMKWAFIPLPTCTLNPDGTVDNMNYTASDISIAEWHGWNTYTLGFHFFPEPAYYNKILPSGSFTVNGQIYTANNYSNAPEAAITVHEFFENWATHLKEHSYLDDFGHNHSTFEEVYLNGHDEIQSLSVEIREQAVKEYKWLKHQANISFPIMQTMLGMDRWPDIQADIDIICLHTGGMEPDFIREWKETGKEVWIYTTRGPRFPAPSLSTSGFALQIRALGWQCFIYNYTHYLIWDVATTYNAAGGYGYQGWNGGTIYYPISGGFAMSHRMELIREGFEDYEYFYYLRWKIEQLQNQNATDIRIAEGTSLLKQIQNLMEGYNPEMNYPQFNQLRIDIGEYLTKFAD